MDQLSTHAAHVLGTEIGSNIQYRLVLLGIQFDLNCDMFITKPVFFKSRISRLC